jgi:CMP-N,N'-diacetyllegionaminic acid synthase
MNTLAVILARAGSVGLPNKHLLSLLGRPVISYTFDHARAAESLTHTVVSSDCPNVRRLAAAAGFPAIERPAHLATSEASVQDVMLHAMDKAKESSGFHADVLVVLYGNVPVRPAGVIDQAIAMLEQTRCDSVRSFCPVGKWHPAWMSRLEGNRVVPLQPGSIHRRQDLPELWLHDGAVVAVSRASMLRGRVDPDPHAFFGTDRRGISTEAGATVEIDRPCDFYLAEAALRAAHEHLHPSLRKAS